MIAPICVRCGSRFIPWNTMEKNCGGFTIVSHTNVCQTCHDELLQEERKLVKKDEVNQE